MYRDILDYLNGRAIDINAISQGTYN